MAKRKRSRSDCQQKAEREIVQSFARKVNCNLPSHHLDLGDCEVQVDGYCESDSRVILVEAWAHVGKARGAQPKKVLADVLKLAFAGERLREIKPTKTVETHMLFADEDAAKVLSSGSWRREAANHFGVKSHTVALTDQTRQSVIEAQKEQDLLDGRKE